MRLSRFFIDAHCPSASTNCPKPRPYIGRVLRHAAGDAVAAVRRQRPGVPGHANPKWARRRDGSSCASSSPASRIAACASTSARGLSRGERMDWAIQKATELGVGDHPDRLERCEVRLKDERADKRLAHWRQVAISACEQCGRSVLPVIHSPITLAWPVAGRAGRAEAGAAPGRRAAGKPCPAAQPGLPDRSRGGLSETEVAQARAAGFTPRASARACAPRPRQWWRWPWPAAVGRLQRPPLSPGRNKM